MKDEPDASGSPRVLFILHPSSFVLHPLSQYRRADRGLRSPLNHFAAGFGGAVDTDSVTGDPLIVPPSADVNVSVFVPLEPGTYATDWTAEDDEMTRVGG